MTPSFMMDLRLRMIMPTTFLETLAGMLTHWAQRLLRFLSFIHCSAVCTRGATAAAAAAAFQTASRRRARWPLPREVALLRAAVSAAGRHFLGDGARRSALLSSPDDSSSSSNSSRHHAPPGWFHARLTLDTPGDYDDGRTLTRERADPRTQRRRDKNLTSRARIKQEVGRRTVRARERERHTKGCGCARVLIHTAAATL